MTVPRLLVIMGSGETSPTMVKTHRQLLGRLGPPPVPAVLLDTPFGFQENASDIAQRAVEYFRQSVGQEVEVASYRSAGIDVLAYETMLTRLRDARYAFSGPGSPTYALREWSSSLVPSLLAEKLRLGGCVVFASAAAVTLGVAALPVYEIYKVGQDPHWLPGLDLLGEAGLQAAVIPHYNNAEGGNHDTRYCYLGERRLRAIETELPGGAFVLGVDEHTGCVLDLDAATASVVGLGAVTVRAHGRSVQLSTGTVVPIARLGELAAELARGSVEEAPPEIEGGSHPAVAGGRARPPQAAAPSPLLEAVGHQEVAFEGAVGAGDVPTAVRAVLELDQELEGWSWDTLQSDER
ncbi:MAG TPA: hypothetical protein VKI64_04090, partial [Acidimicrobiales bacterium]|nr:hypothetical protein [Acidimicrobiales bacterium]